MELPELGQQCCYTDCKQLDFLPLQCQCGKEFCSEHFHTHVQSCQAGTTQNITQQEPKCSVSYKCSAESCNDISLIPLVCPKCQKHFCVKHRHFNDCLDNGEAVAKFKEKRAATLRDFNDAKMAVDEQIHHNLMQAKKKAKNKNLAKQVQLMKIKSKAKGLNSIPTADRLYFNIICPGLAQGNPVFVSKNWSVGRAIDAIANECKLQNNNNASTSKKLRLFKDDSGEAVSRDLATVLETLISSAAIVNGENLIVEYVDDGCQVLVKQS